MSLVLERLVRLAPDRLELVEHRRALLGGEVVGDPLLRRERDPDDALEQRRPGVGEADLIGGVPGTGAVTSWVPLAVFAFLYGLSMDYEVFILSRMREEYDRSGSTDEAVVTGLGRTGRLVTSAALILFLAFVALGAGPETDLRILATGLAAGILLDATVVRALIVPVLISLLGRANWWLPSRRGSSRPAERVASE